VWIGTGGNIKEIVENVRNVSGSIHTFRRKSIWIGKLIDLIQEFPTAGKQIHDANIVATMLVNGVDFLLTYNKDDFKRFFPEDSSCLAWRMGKQYTDQADEPDLRW